MKHTPGPWGRKFRQHIYANNGEGRLIATGMPMNGTSEELEEAFANARLIATAPELLTELIAATLDLEYLSPEKFDSEDHERSWHEAQQRRQDLISKIMKED